MFSFKIWSEKLTFSDIQIKINSGSKHFKTKENDNPYFKALTRYGSQFNDAVVNTGSTGVTILIFQVDSPKRMLTQD